MPEIVVTPDDLTPILVRLPRWRLARCLSPTRTSASSWPPVAPATACSARIDQLPDVVQIPPGDWDWLGTAVMPDTVSLMSNGARLNKRDHLAGWDHPMIAVINTDTGAVHSVRGRIDLIGHGDHVADDIGLYYVGGVTVSTTGVHGTGLGKAAVQFRGNDSRWGAVRGNPTGVVYECSGKDLGYADEDDWFYMGYGVEVIGDELYDAPVVPGSDDMLVVEDCRYDTCRRSIMGGNNAHVVGRYNVTTNQRSFGFPYTSHGKQAWPVGNRWVEY